MRFLPSSHVYVMDKQLVDRVNLEISYIHCILYIVDII